MSRTFVARCGSGSQEIRVSQRTSGRGSCSRRVNPNLGSIGQSNQKADRHGSEGAGIRRSRISRGTTSSRSRKTCELNVIGNEGSARDACSGCGRRRSAQWWDTDDRRTIGRVNERGKGELRTKFEVARAAFPEIPLSSREFSIISRLHCLHKRKPTGDVSNFSFA